MQRASKMQFGIKTAIKSTQSYASLLEVEDIKKKITQSPTERNI